MPISLRQELPKYEVKKGKIIMKALQRKCLKCGTIFESSDWKKDGRETVGEKIIKGTGRFFRISHGEFNPINPDVVTGRTGQNIAAIKMVYECPNCGSMETVEETE